MYQVLYEMKPLLRPCWGEGLSANHDRGWPRDVPSGSSRLAEVGVAQIQNGVKEVTGRAVRAHGGEGQCHAVASSVPTCAPEYWAIEWASALQPDTYRCCEMGEGADGAGGRGDRVGERRETWEKSAALGGADD